MRERFRPTVNETLKIAKILAPTIATAFLAFSAFDIRTRKEIGSRDRWTCQCPGCTRDFRTGYMVTAAHYPEKHHHTGQGYHDNNPKNGRILCQVHHAWEEIERGNPEGARLLLANGIYTWDHADNNGGNVFLAPEDFLERSLDEIMAETEIPVPATQGRFNF